MAVMKIWVGSSNVRYFFFILFFTLLYFTLLSRDCFSPLKFLRCGLRPHRITAASLKNHSQNPIFYFLLSFIPKSNYKIIFIVL